MATAKAKRKAESDATLAEESSPLPFEEAMKRLTGIVSELEEGQLSLEESLARFEEGVRLARVSQEQLDAAEAKVEELLSVDEDGPVTRDLSE